MIVEDLTPTIVRQFLDHLERDRQCCGGTRNQRLATVHSLARFIGMRSPVHLSWCAEIRSIPFKKTTKTLIGYLEKADHASPINQRHIMTQDSCRLTSPVLNYRLQPGRGEIMSAAHSKARKAPFRQPPDPSSTVDFFLDHRTPQSPITLSSKHSRPPPPTGKIQFP